MRTGLSNSWILTIDGPLPVLSSEDASLLAMELGRNPIVDEEAAFDIHPA